MDLRLAVTLIAVMYFSTAAGRLIVTLRKVCYFGTKSVCKTDASSSKHTYTYAKLVVCLEV